MSSPEFFRSFRHRLLAAAPSLQDPNFAQSVVYLAEHTAEGAMGFVMNRPTGMRFDEAVTSNLALPDLVARLPVFHGGPVRPRQIVFAVFEPGPARDIVRCRMDVTVEDLEAAARQQPAWVRVFAGYAGWGESQLEGELAEEAWTVVRPHPALFVDHFLPGLWSAFVSGDNRWRSLTDRLPRDPARN
jgi:putative transcriptional regulator